MRPFRSFIPIIVLCVVFQRTQAAEIRSNTVTITIPSANTSQSIRSQTVGLSIAAPQGDPISGPLVQVSIMPAGDLNHDGYVDVVDLKLLLEIFLGLRTASASELVAGDTRPNPGTGGRRYGDGQIRSDDVNWLLRRVVGLEAYP